MSSAQIRPGLYLLSDYGIRDTGNCGSAVGYSKYFTKLFPDLTFGYPDLVKILETVEVEFESLREVSMTLSVFRSMTIGDPGTRQETVSMATKAVVGSTEPGVFWGGVWTAGTYAVRRMFRYSFPFAMSQGKSFTVGLQANVNQVPFRLIRVVFRFTRESQVQLGTGLLRTP